MKTSVMSRRLFLGAGTCSLALTAGILKSGGVMAATEFSVDNERAVRKYYKSWETRDWQPFDVVLADDFTFTSPNGDDHISKSEFKTRCWDSQVDHIKRFDLLQLFGNGNAAFVMYDCLTKNGKTFRNTEFLQLKNGKIAAIQCFFGGQSTYASAVSTGRQ
jgi:ketosteroid isomerase-like protein